MNHVVALSHPGRRRRKNEDSVLHHERADGDLLLAVADGVGGERAGEVASAEAVRVLRDEYGQPESDDPALRLRHAVIAANAAVWNKSRDSARFQGMSTTLVAGVVRAGQAWIANVGDSRAYIVEDGALRQLTQDHSLVAERVREGELTEDEARHSRVRNVITRSVGSEEEVEVDIFGPLDLAQGTRLLLCSDGLTDVVDDGAIESVAAKEPLKEAAQHLVDLANRGGGPDNISVILFEAADAPAAPRKQARVLGVEPPGRYAIAGITTALVALIGGGIMLAGAAGSASSPEARVLAQPAETRVTAVLAMATTMGESGGNARSWDVQPQRVATLTPPPTSEPPPPALAGPHATPEARAPDDSPTVAAGESPVMTATSTPTISATAAASATPTSSPEATSTLGVGTTYSVER